MAVYAVFALASSEQWIAAALVAIGVVAINAVYLIPGLLPAKYLTPGLVFLLIFQIFVVVYSGYIAFTNFGSGHNSSKEDAVSALLLQSQTRVADSPTYPVKILEKDGKFFLLTADPDTGKTELGGAAQPLASVPGISSSGAPGYTTLDFQGVIAHQDDIAKLAVPIAKDVNKGYLKTTDGSNAYLFTSTLKWDPKADTMTDTKTGVVYSDTGHGAFTAEDGTKLLPGWQVWVGGENFVRAFSDQSIRGPFFAVLLWTFAFAILSVATTFILGLFLAIVFNDPKMRSRKYYRVIMILPYAFPRVPVGAGMGRPVQHRLRLHQPDRARRCLDPVAHGPVARQDRDPHREPLARLPVHVPRDHGALQSLPDDVVEAARVDGASVWQTFRLIKFPLLLVAVAPLLIASFAFNFNNFGLIFLLTGGGPQIAGGRASTWARPTCSSRWSTRSPSSAASGTTASRALSRSSSSSSSP